MAPPIGTLLIREYRPSLVQLGVLPSSNDWRGGSETEDLTAALDQLKKDVQTEVDTRVRLEQALERAKQRLGAVGAWRRDYPDMSVRSVRVLPIADSSPVRHALWIAADDGRPFLRNSTLVADGGRLVGVVRSFSGSLPKNGGAATAGPTRRSQSEPDVNLNLEPSSLGSADSETIRAGRFVFTRVQTVLDPTFRIRGRVGSMWGFLQGTGEADDAGKPLLRLHLLSGDAALEPGQRIYSDIDDGRYPSGLAVGEIIEQTRVGSDPEYLVRATIDPLALTEAVLLADEALTAALEARLQDGGP